MIEVMFFINKKDKTERKIFGEVQPISQHEFFEAGQLGLTPELKAIVWSFDYKQEDLLKLRNRTYSIYRTYERYDNKIELYLKSRTGDRKVNV